MYQDAEGKRMYRVILPLDWWCRRIFLVICPPHYHISSSAAAVYELWRRKHRLVVWWGDGLVKWWNFVMMSSVLRCWVEDQTRVLRWNRYARIELDEEDAGGIFVLWKYLGLRQFWDGRRRGFFGRAYFPVYPAKCEVYAVSPGTCLQGKTTRLC